MRVSLNWLKEFISIDLDADGLAHKLMMLGLDVKSVEHLGEDIENVVVGQILSIEPHPEADKLVVCRTDIGETQPIQIVCGARNMSVGDKVPTAKVGAHLPGNIKIGRRKMRGVESFGMMCSGKELGINQDHEGLLILDNALPVGKDVRPFLGLDDVVFEIEVTPNRGDWASVMGVARELSASFGIEFQPPPCHVHETDEDVARLSSVVIEDPELCPRYIGRVLTDVRVGPSEDWVCRRLAAAGQRPINNVVDITNYVLLETGQPLHAFDYDKLVENRIIVRRARPGEAIRTIDQVDRRLSPEMLVIADGQMPVAIAGIMGGLDTEVTETTTRVFLESAFFDPVSVRRTAKALGIMTEASQRFQRGADPAMARYAIDRAAELMREHASARVALGVLDQYPKPLMQKEIRVRYRRSNELLGPTIPPDEQRGYLVNLGFQLLDADSAAARFRAPSWRHDCSVEADLIEEIARLHGYDTIETTLPVVRRSEQVFAPEEKRVRDLRTRLIESGLTEVMNMTFSSPEEVARAGLDESYSEMVRLANPLSANHSAMRTGLLPGVLRTAAYSARHGAKNLRIFEMGPVYHPIDGEDLPRESLRLAVLLSGSISEKHWSRPLEDADLYDVKGIAECILAYFGVATVCEPAVWGPMEPQECGRLVLDGKGIGFFGRLKTAILSAYELDRKAYALEIDLDPLLELHPVIPQYEPIPAFPPALRDLAVIVDISTPAGALQQAALQAGGRHLQSVDIFDVYIGQQIPKGKKSVALSLVFQSKEHTLTEEHTQKAWENILRKLESDFGAELR